MILLRALVALAILWTTNAHADINLLKENKCDQCHRVSISDDEKNEAPDLFYAGEKFQESWLREFLTNPNNIRPNGYSGRNDFPKAIEPKAHPALNAKVADAVANVLLTLKLQPAGKSIEFGEPLTRGKKVRAKILFERNFSCSACHKGINLARKPHGGVSGPSLFNAGNRLQQQWIFDWLKSPEKYRKKGRMPRFQLDDETAIKLVKYIMTLKKENMK